MAIIFGRFPPGRAIRYNVRKSIDGESYSIRFTPRKKTRISRLEKIINVSMEQKRML